MTQLPYAPVLISEPAIPAGFALCRNAINTLRDGSVVTPCYATLSVRQRTHSQKLPSKTKNSLGMCGYVLCHYSGNVTVGVVKIH